ncbi:MAG: M48 family metalloprotease [Alphaproteobacteria bacterium]|nr:M48 family metalloprotease [Alphaproteobacteria bacterium]
MTNTLKTTFLMATLTALFVLVGGALAGRGGMAVMLVLASLMNLGTWFFSDRIVLATSGAQPIDDPRLQWLVDDVAELAQRAGIPTPRVYLVPNEASPNAFATGRDPAHGVVAVTAGLLQTLDRRQIRGVLAHELGHIRHRDTLTSAVAATMAGAVTMLARLAFWTGGDRDTPMVARLATMLLAPIAATLLHLAVSRSREYAADARAAALTGDPEGLASALERISGIGARVPMHTGSEATHYIANTFGGGLGGLFSTHPPMEERVRRLRGLRASDGRDLGGRPALAR